MREGVNNEQKNVQIAVLSLYTIHWKKCSKANRIKHDLVAESVYTLQNVLCSRLYIPRNGTCRFCRKKGFRVHYRYLSRPLRIPARNLSLQSKFDYIYFWIKKQRKICSNIRRFHLLFYAILKTLGRFFYSQVGETTSQYLKVCLVAVRYYPQLCPVLISELKRSLLFVPQYQISLA